MKILNIFKKVTSTSSVTEKINIQKMDAKQLSKVIGGDGPTIPDETMGAINTSRSNIRSPA